MTGVLKKGGNVDSDLFLKSHKFQPKSEGSRRGRKIANSEICGISEQELKCIFKGRGVSMLGLELPSGMERDYGRERCQVSSSSGSPPSMRHNHLQALF